MTDDEFDSAILAINEKRAVTISLSLSQRQFEIVLDTALRNDSLQLVSFVGYFNATQKSIILNLYIAAKYDGNGIGAQDLELLARQNRIDLRGNFSFYVNIFKHHIELHGFNAFNINSARTRQQVAYFKNNINQIFVNALTAGDVSKMLHAYHYLTNRYKLFSIDSVINGKTPLMWACEADNDHMVDALITKCKATLFATYSGKDAIDQICKNTLVRTLHSLLLKKQLVPCKFNSPGDKDYDYQQDIYRRIIDANNSRLILTVLRQQYTSSAGFIPDMSLVKQLYLYAKQKNSLLVAGALQPLYERALALEKNFIDAIKNDLFDKFIECVNLNVDINCTVDDQYPIALICQLGRVNMLRRLLQPGSPLIHYDFVVTPNPGVLYQQDIVYQAIKADKLEIFKEFYNAYGIKIVDLPSAHLQSMLTLAEKSQAPNISAYLAKIQAKKNATKTRLFQLAISEEYDELLDLAGNIDSIDFLIDGQSILHILCSKNASAAAQALLSLGLDVNIINDAKEYPITIAARNGNTYLVSQFLARPELKVCSFNNSLAWGYEPNLDICRIAIDRDDDELLSTLLRDTKRSLRFGELNIINLKSMLAYATQKQRPAIIALLNNFINILQAGRQLFNEDAYATADYTSVTQNVSRTDRTAVSSLKELAKHYQFEIKYDPIAKRYKLSSDLHDIQEIFSRLEEMINSVKQSDICYPIHKLAKAGNGKTISKEDYSFSHYLDVSDFKEYARQMFTSINEGKEGKNGCYATWYCDWIHPGQETLFSNIGLTTKEIWALVILAALDECPFPDKWLDEDEIWKNKVSLVLALVKAARGYNTNNDWEFDLGGKSLNRCVHGTAMEPLLAFSYKHPAIKMLTSPMPWALQLVVDTCREYFSTNSSSELSSSLLLDHQQLKGAKRARVDTFYQGVYKAVETKLLTEIKLLSDGGYLLKSEFDEAMLSIQHVQLVTADTLEADRSAFVAADGTIVPNKTINGLNGLPLAQLKIPFTTDSIFNALLLSAADQQITIPNDFNSPAKMRARIHKVFDFAFNSSVAYMQLPSHINRIIKSRYGCVFICPQDVEIDTQYEQAEEARVNGNMAKVPELLRSLLENGAPDIIMLEVLSILLSVKISVYSFGGRHLLDINCGSIGCKLPDGHKTLNICVACIKVGAHHVPNFSHVTALVNKENESKILRTVREMSLKSLREQLLEDEARYNNYQPMVLRNVVVNEQTMQQIKIPVNGDSALNAILSAALNIDNIVAQQIANADDLRQRLYTTLLDIQDERISEEQLSSVGVPFCALGLIEISVLAEMLLLKIIIKHTNQVDCTVLNADAAETIFLLETDGHFNVLTPENTWHTDLTPRVQQAPTLAHT